MTENGFGAMFEILVDGKPRSYRVVRGRCHRVERAHPRVGDGLVARTCAEGQRRYWSPPVERSAPGRWGALVLLSQKVAANDGENHLFGKIHTSAMGGWNGSAEFE